MRAFKNHHYFVAFVVFISVINSLSAQQNPGGNPNWNKAAGQGPNVIPTGVPVLLIAPDSRSGSLGDLGVASTPDVNSTHWNNAKFAFLEDEFGVGLSYSPWMQSLIGDMHLAYLSAYWKMNKRSAFAASLTYFDLGSIEFFNVDARSQGSYNPYEMSVDATYSMKLTDNLSAALTGRYINSNLTLGQYVDGIETHPGNAGAVDLGLYWTHEVSKGGRNVPDEYAIGLNISNLGTKISYSEDLQQDYLPANLRLGGRYTFRFDKFNELSTMVDFNKLLVPTPQYIYDSTGKVITGRQQVDVSSLKGAIESFSDAPGGFKEEMEEITISIGLEYWYNKTFTARVGYFYENENKGNRQYFTIGGGLRYNVFGLDISYLIPVTQKNPLQNTIRFSLLVNFKNS